LADVIHNDATPGQGLAAQAILAHAAAMMEPDGDTDYLVAEHFELFKDLGATAFNGALEAAEDASAGCHELVYTVLRLWQRLLPEFASDAAVFISQLAHRLWPEGSQS
jgi:hypothetical protein